jgi:hypothetical protein
MMTMPSSRFFTASPPLARHGALSQWLHRVGTKAMSIIGACPRSFCLISIQAWPWRGIGAATPGQSLPTYSSMADSVHNWQFVHSTTSMIMFHFFIL